MITGGPKIFEVLVEIVDPSYVYSRGVLNAPSKEVFPVFSLHILIHFPLHHHLLVAVQDVALRVS